MMPDLHVGWHLAVLLLSLGGFALLALSSEREGAVLLHRSATTAERHVFRWGGWLFLGLAIALCAWGWLVQFGTVLWLGWLTVAAVGLVFAIAYWPWRQRRPPIAARKPKGDAGKPVPIAVEPTWRPRARQWCRCGLLIALLLLPPLFVLRLWQAPITGILRTDAVRGEIGPWTYVLAESDLKAPNIVPNGSALKAFELRLTCNPPVSEAECQSQIRRAYLKVRKPRNLRAAGNAFTGKPWRRMVEIAIPPGSRLSDQIWLTIESSDGLAYEAAFDFSQISPATTRFIEENE